jgi:aminoglycoside phosphotransferase (APT) family kinase protein
MLHRILGRALPGRRVVDVQPLTEGLRNANFKLRLDSMVEPLVLRLYEHDASICRKEIDLMGLVGGSVPVPEVIHAEASGLEGIQPFALLRYVDGVTFRDLRRSGDLEAIAQAAFSAGEVLAAIGHFRFPKPGWLGPGPAVGAPLLEGADPFPRFVDLCLASEKLPRRVPEELRERIHALVWEQASAFAAMATESRLVHGDFSGRNLVVRCISGRWSVAAVLDWEFAVSGTPLADLGNFLRYQGPSEPHFSRGFAQGGGELPGDWRRLAQWIDLIAMCESLTHDSLPDQAAIELADLLRAIVTPAVRGREDGSSPG